MIHSEDMETQIKVIVNSALSSWLHFTRNVVVPSLSYHYFDMTAGIRLCSANFKISMKPRLTHILISKYLFIALAQNWDLLVPVRSTPSSSRVSRLKSSPTSTGRSIVVRRDQLLATKLLCICTTV